LFLSGGPGDASADLLDISEHLSKNYQCILFDQRGTGESHTNPLDSTTINLKVAISDIHLFLQRLKIKSISLLGHSWGTMLAISYAIKYPNSVTKLILIDPGPLKWAGFENMLNEIINAKASKADRELIKHAENSIAKHTASKELLEKYSLTFDKLLFYSAAQFYSIYTTMKKQNTIPAHSDKIEHLMEQDLTRINYNVRPEISKLKMPIFVLCGREDPVSVFPTFNIKELNRKAKIAWIEKSGHFSWLENPKSFYSHLNNFLK